MTYRYIYALLLAALVSPWYSMAETTDHTGAPANDPNRSQVDQTANPNKLYKMINACLDGRPGSGSSSTNGTGATLGGAADGASTFQARCLSCHGPKDPRKSIDCINGPCPTSEGVKAQMPPGGPLSADEKTAIIGFLNSK